MTTPRAQALIDDCAANAWLIHRHADGVSDEASLRQPPFPANCLNWVLGHIVWRRTSALAVLGLASPWDEATAARYRTGSEPLRSPDDARPFSQLLADLDATQAVLSAALEAMDDAALDRAFENDRGEKRVIEHLQGFHWHETYHLGQLELLRAFCESAEQADKKGI